MADPASEKKSAQTPQKQVGTKAAESCGLSFTPGTKVLLASGKAAPIASLKPGEKVATDTKTGKTAARAIAAVLVHHDTNRYDLTIRADGRTAVIGTTSNHPFWDATAGRWVKACALRYGTYLRTPSGGTATVLGGRPPQDRSGWMWDLTITGDHDFYVATTVVDILVHNCNEPPGLDGSGKIYTTGDLPNHVPSDWTSEQLEQLESDLQQSIQTRQQAFQDLGEEAAHMRRLQAEIQLLRQVQKRLSGT